MQTFGCKGAKSTPGVMFATCDHFHKVNDSYDMG